MSYRKILIAGLICIFCLGIASIGTAKVNPKEAERLKGELTPMGAERAGNADGSIPAWEGGLTTPPAGFQKGGNFVDPFAGDSVLFKITAQNMDQYKDKLSAGQQAMLKRYPNTYYMNVYPAHRTAAFPKAIYDDTLKNATECMLTADGYGVEVNNGLPGIPFPIPNNGNEIIFNVLHRYMGAERPHVQKQHLVNKGKATDGGHLLITYSYPWYDLAKYGHGGFPEIQHYCWAEVISPARRKGEYILVYEPFDMLNSQRKAWRYIPGARRVRLAPSIAYDGANAAFGGMVFQDEGVGLWYGAPDRYDWKIVGKKEMYIPYNSYAAMNVQDDQIWTGNHANAQLNRWELHRVWVLEATVREGKRHQYARRTFYIDEDSWSPALHDAYDAQGTLWRTSQANLYTDYSAPAVIFSMQFYYDLQTTTWGTNHSNGPSSNIDIRQDKTLDYSFYDLENLRLVGRR